MLLTLYCDNDISFKYLKYFNHAAVSWGKSNLPGIKGDSETSLAYRNQLRTKKYK